MTRYTNILKEINKIQDQKMRVKFLDQVDVINDKELLKRIRDTQKKEVEKMLENGELKKIKLVCIAKCENYSIAENKYGVFKVSNNFLDLELNKEVEIFLDQEQFEVLHSDNWIA